MENIIKLEAPKFPSEIKLEAEWLSRRDKLVKNAIAITGVNNQDDYDDAEVALSRVAKLAKEVDKKRLTFTKPFRDFTKQINDMTSAAVTDLITEKARIKLLLTDYVIKKDEEAQALLEDQAMSEDSCFDAPAIIPDAPVSRTMTNVRKTWAFKVEDLSKVPLEFLIVNDSKVREYIKNNKEMADIEGISIFKETTVVNR